MRLLLTHQCTILTALALMVQSSAFSPTHTGAKTQLRQQQQQQQQQQCHRNSSRGGTSRRYNSNGDDLPDFELPEEKAERLQKQAEVLRRQIRDMEAQLQATRKERNYETPKPATTDKVVDADNDIDDGNDGRSMTLRKKRVLVAGANGRLGSMVCRYLLRNHPEIGELVAAVHVVSESSLTARGYGRLSYEVGAEDGVGTIGTAWSAAEDRTATYTFDDSIMADYNLNKLRLVECELLDPVQCATVCENVDAVIWCATDFNGNTPRAVSGLNVAFLFRAVASPTKGRVEIEGLQNMLGALKLAKQDRQRKNGGKESQSDPINFILVSMVPEAFGNFETPFGEFNSVKRQAEQMVKDDFPSLTHAVLQMGQYDDNFVPEGEAIFVQNDPAFGGDRQRRLINRRDAAKAAVEALLDKDLKGKTVQVYTAIR